jgi:hypothetical protein
MRPVTDSQRLAQLIGWCGEQVDILAALDAALAEAVGHRVFTCWAVDGAGGTARRVYTNRPSRLPRDATLPLEALPVWRDMVVEGRAPWIGPGVDEVAAAFPCDETLAALGCGACLSLPVIDRGAVIGIANMLHVEGFYDLASLAAAAPFAPLFVAPCRDPLGDRP